MSAHDRARSATARSSPSGRCPGTPRPYDFPAVAEHRLANGLRDPRRRPARPAARLGLADPADRRRRRAGRTRPARRSWPPAPCPRAPSSYDAIALIEAAERLGASLHAEAGWDAMTAGLDVPADRLAAGARAPRRARPAPDVPGRRGRAPARRAPQRPAPGQGRPAPAGRGDLHRHDLRAGVAVPPPGRRDPRDGRGLEPDDAAPRLAARPRPGAGDARRRRRPRRAGRPGDRRAPVRRLGRRGPAWPTPAVRSTTRRPRRAAWSGSIHRPGSVQTEIRIGHRGLPRRIPDFHAVSVMSAILGGLFNSRLNMKLREEKGYTYGAGAGFDLRRGAGPFAARAAVNTEVTVPAILDTLAELTTDARHARSPTPSSPRRATS